MAWNGTGLTDKDRVQTDDGCDFLMPELTQRPTSSS